MKNSDMPANPVKGCDDDFIECNDLNGSWIDKCKPSIGLTKREAFAMAAMQGWLARCANVPHTHKLEPENMAEVSVSMADALLKELDK